MRRFVVGLALVLALVAIPSWAMAGDQEIANELVKQLQAKKAAGELTKFGIDLEIDHGVVWLKGHVSSPKHRELVLSIAKSIDGVEEVIDDITIRQSTAAKSPAPKKPGFLAALTGTAEPASRKKATPQASKRLMPTIAKPSKKSATPIARAKRLAVTPKATQVRPASEVAVSETAAQAALPVAPADHQVAPAVPSGAPEATHHLHDHSAAPARPSDAEIAQAVIARLRQQQQSGALRDFTLDVTVDAGSVWIKGNVASPEQQRLVLEVARRVYGVTQVVNDITVQQVAVAAQPIANYESRLKPARMQEAGAPPQTPAPSAAPQAPVAFAPASGAQPVPMNAASGIARARYDHPTMPAYAWPSYAAYPNYGAVTYPKQYSPAAWPYIGPFYPYPQVPLGWRKVTLQWDDGWWFLDFKSK